ncbi:hypothetical protein EOM81_12890, partial [bacterium]|nr:hypothetical protein [bacterium]
MYPDIFSNLDLETAKNLELANAIREVNEELDRRSDVKGEERVVEITKELTKLRAEHGKFVFAGTESYQINNLYKIRELEKERAEWIRKAREDREADAAATTDLADWQKKVNDFVSKTGATSLAFSNEDGTAYSYV